MSDGVGGRKENMLPSRLKQTPGLGAGEAWGSQATLSALVSGWQFPRTAVGGKRPVCLPGLCLHPRVGTYPKPSSDACSRSPGEQKPSREAHVWVYSPQITFSALTVHV